MNLQTKIPLYAKEPKVDYNSEIVLLGSCFAENIGEKFEYFKFKNENNPFGILFHPKAIETFLWMATQGDQYTETDLFQINEQWHCFDAHSSLSSSNQETALSNLNNALVVAQQKIRTATHIFITLGTSWVYRLKSLDMIVANCHKIPQNEFQKELLSIEDITQCLQNSVHLIHSLNPLAEIIFTVSPVRHTKDGFIENNRSKSHLIASIHQIVNGYKKLSYFPSYEIMMDELRDYRFYDTDMVHPSKLAIEYIWERFVKVWVSEDAIKTMDRVEEIKKGIAHKPFNPKSKQYQLFLEKIEFKKYQIQQEYPFMDF